MWMRKLFTWKTKWTGAVAFDYGKGGEKVFDDGKMNEMIRFYFFLSIFVLVLCAFIAITMSL
jgi:hypothetical protein